MNTLRSACPTTALLRLCSQPAACFGTRLLERADGPAIPFRTFVQVARDMVQSEPEGTATWLAALVALQMCEARAPADMVHEPSPN